MSDTPMRDWLALVGYCGVIFFLSSQSSLPMPMAFPNQDKLEHASAYALMSLLAWRAFKGMPCGRALPWLAVGFASLYGMSDEFHQSFVPSRDADVWDWLADTTGATLMVLCLHRWQARRMMGKSLSNGKQPR